jgi:hypothetical protein
MPQANVIRWREGAGWLVLSGGGYATGGGDSSDDHLSDDDFSSEEITEIEAEALTRVAAGDPIAYVWAANDLETADKHLEALHDLGGPTGYLVDVLTEDDDSLRQQLSGAGMIVLGDGPNARELRSGILGAAIEAIGVAFEKGAVVLGVGSGAALLGSVLTEQAGLAWVENAVIVPGYERDGQDALLRDLLAKHPMAYGLGISTGSALALGPNGEIETWGKKQVTIALGRGAV